MQHPASGVTWDALDAATGLTAVAPMKGPSINITLERLTQQLGHLQNLDSTDEIPADRNKPMRSGLPPDRLMIAYLDNLQLIERAADIPGPHWGDDVMKDLVNLYSGSVPALYDRYRGPVFFEPYARDLARHLHDVAQGSVLEIAAGTGIVTRILAQLLPEGVTIIASDVSPAMIEFAARQPGIERVVWRQADALALPFADGAFEAVLCQFGVMFFADKVAGYREAFRALKARGRFVFNVWDRIEQNEFCWVVSEAVAGLFPEDPPGLMARTPYGYYDTDVIAEQVGTAGFRVVSVETVERQSHAPSARDLAIGFCQGSPLRSEIEARDATRLGEATDAATKALLARFGSGPIVGKMRAHVITAAR